MAAGFGVKTLSVPIVAGLLRASLYASLHYFHFVHAIRPNS